jgi:hypothetical protein
MTKCVIPLRHLVRLIANPARPIRTLHLDDLVLLFAKCLRGFTYFVIAYDILNCLQSLLPISLAPLHLGPALARRGWQTPHHPEAAAGGGGGGGLRERERCGRRGGDDDAPRGTERARPRGGGRG